MKLKVRIRGCKVHEVGYRVFLLRKALELGAERFNALNSEENELQVITAFVEGTEEIVTDFSEAVRTCKPVGADVLDISSQEYKGYVIGIGDYMHLLQVEQLSKGIPALLSIDQKQDRMLEKQDLMLGKQDQMLDKQDELVVEVRDINRKFDKVLDRDIVELKNDMIEIKMALRAKGII
jgi:hypothetical protein